MYSVIIYDNKYQPAAKCECSAADIKPRVPSDLQKISNKCDSVGDVLAVHSIYPRTQN